MAGAGGVLVGRGYVSIRPEFEGNWSRSVSARASDAGRSGASAFSKAFGAGLKGIGALAGVAIGANLSAAAAGAALLAPALTTAGTAAGALKLGLSGVGEAFKAAFADSSADVKAAASATKAVESAQRGLANAQRALADARVQAAERVREAQKAVADAEQNLARVVEDSAQRQRDAQQSVRDAERDLRDAQHDAREAQASLTDARVEATQALQDMNQRLSESRLDEREAVLRLKEAEKELRAAQSNPGVTPQQLERLQIQYERAKLNLQQQRQETKRLSDDTAKANKAGVEGSEQMQRARERLASANETVTDRERGLAKAREDARRTGVDAARDVADAQQALADAQADVDKARADGQRQVEDAQRAVAEAASAVADAQAAAAAQTSKFDEAMSKLAPNAQSFVRAVQGLAPAWSSMRLSVQNELFRGLDSTVTSLGRTAIPVLQRQLTETAGVWNAMAKSAAGAVTEMAKSGMLNQILSDATKNLRVFEDTPGQLITAWGQLAVAAQPAFNSLLTQMAGAISSFAGGIADSFESGGLEQAISTAFGILSQFGTLLGNVLGTVQEIFRAASDAGGQIVGALAAVFGELERILAAPEMQAQLRSLFASVAQIVAAVVPIIGSVVQAAVPLLAAIAEPVAVLATALGPVLQQTAAVLGEALLSIVNSMDLATVVEQLSTALVPLLDVALALVPVAAQIVVAFGPALASVFAALAQVLIAVTPLIQLTARLLTAALLPVVGIVAGVVNTLAAALAGLARWLQQNALFLAPVATLVAGLTLVMNAQRIATAAVTAVFAIYRGVILAATAVTRAFTVVQAALTAVMRANPIGLVITALVALVTAIVIAYKRSETFRKVVQAAWHGIRVAASASWAFIREKIFAPIRTFFTQTVPDWARTLASRVVGAYQSMRTGISNVWGWIKKNILYPIRDFFTKTVPGWAAALKDRLVGAFDAARKGIGKAFDKIKNATKTPIKWVIDVVYNQGVRGLWNAAAKVLPIDKLPKFAPKGWARGGVLPGYQSAKRDDVLTPMRSGEGVLVPEVVRGIGPGTIHALNDAGNRGGAGAVRRLLGYAEGGIVGHHGGITDWFGGTMDKLGDLVKKGKNWILGGVYKAAQLAAKPIRDLIARIPGGTKGFGALAKALPTSLLNKALSFIKGSEDSQMGGGQWVKPVDARYGTKFGVAGRMWSSGRHTGLDFPAAVGKAVHAVANGQIASARSGGPYGNHILINHGHGLQSLYAHLSAMVKKAGAVQAGQTIGRVGATGNVTGPHLHLEARLNGRPVDPMPYLTSGGQGSGGKGVQRWRGVVNQALDLVGQPRGHANATLRRMNQESGGDPNIVNRWDSNWKAGTPSVGLMQVIGPTFRAHAGRFRNTGPFLYGVSTNPLANIYASMRYALSRYGSLPRAYNRPGGYDEGGWLGPGQIGVNHLRQPEAVLTPSQWRTMSSLAAAGGAARFEGDLYLDSGEFLGRVRGEAQQVVMERDRLVMAAGRGGRRP